MSRTGETGTVVLLLSLHYSIRAGSDHRINSKVTSRPCKLGENSGRFMWPAAVAECQSIVREREHGCRGHESGAVKKGSKSNPGYASGIEPPLNLFGQMRASSDIGPSMYEFMLPSQTISCP